jgi:hypothetical protein
LQATVIASILKEFGDQNSDIRPQADCAIHIMLELYGLIVIRPQVKVPLERERREHKVEDNHEPLLRLIVQEGEYEDHDYLLNQALHVCL